MSGIRGAELLLLSPLPVHLPLLPDRVFHKYLEEMSNALSSDSGPNALAYRVVSTLATLLGTCIVSFCLGQRTYTFDVFSRRGLSSMTVSRFWLLFLLVDSLFFLVGSGVLLQDIGLSQNRNACTIAESFCISFYFISKGAAYFLFLEKVYAVWPNRGSRLTSTAYKVGLVALISFLCLLVVCIIGREAYIREDGQCMIGTQNSVTLTVLLVDLAVNALLTSLFLVPLMRRSKLSLQVREVAVRNLIAASCCFVSSVANMAAITAMQGHEVAWVCVASCSADICINAVIAFWVTRPPTQSESGTGDISGTVWRVATRKMDADETVLSRFQRKNSLRVDVSFSNDQYQSRSLPGDELDSSSVHSTHIYPDSDTKSLPGVAFPMPSRARNGSTARLLASGLSRSHSATTAPRSPPGASSPNAPAYGQSRQLSPSISRSEPRIDADQSSNALVDALSEPDGHNLKGHVGDQLLEEVERVLSARGETGPGRGRRLA